MKRNWTVRSNVHLFDPKTGKLIEVVDLDTLSPEALTDMATRLGKAMVEGAYKDKRVTMPAGCDLYATMPRGGVPMK